MKITQEQLDKLPQMDRIEFMLAERRINDNKIKIDGSIFFWKMAATIGFLFLFIASIFPYAPEQAFKILSFLPVLIKMTVLIFFGICGFDFIFWIKYLKELKELRSKYFKIEVKARKHER
jgi:hypothetical protein